MQHNLRTIDLSGGKLLQFMRTFVSFPLAHVWPLVQMSDLKLDWEHLFNQATAEATSCASSVCLLSALSLSCEGHAIAPAGLDCYMRASCMPSAAAWP